MSCSSHTYPYHHSIVSFGSDDTAHALCSLADSIKGQEVALLDLEHLTHVLQSGPAERASIAERPEGEQRDMLGERALDLKHPMHVLQSGSADMSDRSEEPYIWERDLLGYIVPLTRNPHALDAIRIQNMSGTQIRQVEKEIAVLWNRRCR